MADEQKPDEQKPELLGEDFTKKLDDDLVSRFYHFEELAVRILSHDGKTAYQQDEVNHMAEMLLLLDIATHPRQISFSRFRARYAGSYD
jgi:hypothetical protein